LKLEGMKRESDQSRPKTHGNNSAGLPAGPFSKPSIRMDVGHLKMVPFYTSVPVDLTGWKAI
jgi:hypothetical protein